MMYAMGISVIYTYMTLMAKYVIFVEVTCPKTKSLMRCMTLFARISLVTRSMIFVLLI